MIATARSDAAAPSRSPARPAHRTSGAGASAPLARAAVADTRRSTRRVQGDRLLMRADWLDRSDRALLVQVLGNGVRPADVADLLGLSTRTVQRRIRRLVKRLNSPTTAAVLAHEGHWDRKTFAVAVAVWIRGWTLRRTAEHMNISLHRVRQHLQIARGLIKADGDAGALRSFNAATR